MSKLICFGLVLVPYLRIIGIYSRQSRMMTSVFIALILSMYGIKQTFFDKKFLGIGIFLMYIMFSAWQAPKPVCMFNDVNISNFYVWKPFVSIIFYSLAFIVLSKVELNFKLIETTMVWTASVMAIQSSFQSFGIAQWAISKGGNLDLISGFLGTRAVVGIFLAIVIPIAIRRRMYVNAGILFIAVLITRCHIPIFISLIGVCIYTSILNHALIKWTILLGLIFLSVIGYDIVQNKQSQDRILFRDSKRIINWKSILEDCNKKGITGNPRPYTGKGLGSFEYIYHEEHKEDHNKKDYLEAHNEYWEVLYELGIYGLAITLFLIWMFVLNIHPNTENAHLYASSIMILLAAGGMFVWHLGVTSFYSLVIIGLLNNKVVD